MDDERKIALASFNDDTITPMLLELFSGLKNRAVAAAEYRLRWSRKIGQEVKVYSRP